MDDPFVTFPEVSYAEWRLQVEAQLADLGFEDVLVGRSEGIAVEALATDTHPKSATRGAALLTGPRFDSMEEIPWVPCQSFDDADPEKLNHHLKFDLENGVPGIWIRMDQVARLGTDPITADSVGVDGAALYRIEDFLSAFRDTSSNWRVLLLDSGSRFLPVAAMVVSWLRNAGLDAGAKTLLLGADPLEALARDGAIAGSLDLISTDLASLIRYSQEHWPEGRALAISTQPYREAGAELDQELGISLATGAQYLRMMERCGLEPEEVVSQLALVTSTGSQTFLEIAKLRALRVLWDQLQKACMTERLLSPWIHASVMRRSLPSREPSLNLLRITAASFAAVLGGADSQETPRYDWFDRTAAADRGRRLARNTQLILGLESQMGRVADPSRGSYLMEAMTQELAERGWAAFQEIERQGGLIESLSSGWLQTSIEARWEERRARLERAEIPLTGVNIYPDVTSGFHELTPGEDFRVLQKSIRERFATQSENMGSLEIRDPASTTTRFEWCLETAAANHSVLELSHALYGDQEGLTVDPLEPRRDSEPFERDSVGS